MIHITPRRTYLIVYFVLLGLLVLTVGAAYIDLGGWGILLSLGIAVIKALLILFYFMHLRTTGDRIVWIFTLLAFALLGTLFVLSFSDYVSRSWVGST
jgi:cytochrome c oxidase subunit 4